MMTYYFVRTLTIGIPNKRRVILNGQYGEDSNLQYDLSVPFARYLVMQPEAAKGSKLFKRYQIGRVYRRDNPFISTDRYQEFHQCDFDIAEKYDKMIKSDFECLSIVYEILNELNLGEFRIKVNHHKLLDDLFAVCGVPVELFKTIGTSVVKKDMLCKGISEETAVKVVTLLNDLCKRFDELCGGHSGRVNTAVLGKIRFRFDVNSKDVIIANLIESNGKKFKVHISETVYNLIRY